MAPDDSSPLTDEERAELEQLRAAKRMRDEASQRAELETLRKNAKYAEEDRLYYEERERRKEERRRERENPDYGLDDLPPMPKKQKIVLAVLGVMAAAAIIYVIWFNVVH